MHSKRKTAKRVLLSIALIVAAVLLIHIISMLTVDKSIEYTEADYRSAKIDASLDGYVIAFIADTHTLPDASAKEIVRHMNGRGIDLLLLGGDHAQDGTVGELMEVLSHTQTTDGIYGVEGNHDDFTELFAAQRAYGIVPLDNKGVRLRNGLYLGGVSDLWNRTPDVQAALRGAAKDDFSILLCHNPDVAMQQDTTAAGLMLSGHTHGGHVTVFGIWAPALSLRDSITDYGQRFMAGWCQGAFGTDVYVTRGTGWFKNTPRVFARPQVVYLTLRAA